MVRRKILLFLPFLIFILLFPNISQADRAKRIAPVIGNAGYKGPPLKNPINDAEDMAAVLKGKGFRLCRD